MVSDRGSAWVHVSPLGARDRAAMSFRSGGVSAEKRAFMGLRDRPIYIELIADHIGFLAGAEEGEKGEYP